MEFYPRTDRCAAKAPLLGLAVWIGVWAAPFFLSSSSTSAAEQGAARVETERVGKTAAEDPLQTLRRCGKSVKRCAGYETIPANLALRRAAKKDNSMAAKGLEVCIRNRACERKTVLLLSEILQQSRSHREETLPSDPAGYFGTSGLTGVKRWFGMEASIVNYHQTEEYSLSAVLAGGEASRELAFHKNLVRVAVEFPIFHLRLGFQALDDSAVTSSTGAGDSLIVEANSYGLLRNRRHNPWVKSNGEFCGDKPMTCDNLMRNMLLTTIRGRTGYPFRSRRGMMHA